MRKLTIQTSGSKKDIANPIASTRDEETYSQRLARKSVEQNNLKERRFKHHIIKDVFNGYRIVFDRDKEGNLIPNKL